MAKELVRYKEQSMEAIQQGMCRSILKLMRDTDERKRFEEWKKRRVENAT